MMKKLGIDSRIGLYGSNKEVEQAEQIITASLPELPHLDEPAARLAIQQIIDDKRLKADILINGNGIYSYDRVIRDIRKVQKHGMKAMSRYLYGFFHLSAGSIVRPYESEHDLRIHRTFWHHWSLPLWFTTPIKKGLSASAVKLGDYRANLYIDTSKNDEYIVYLWGAYYASSSQAFGLIGHALDLWLNSNVPQNVIYKFSVLIGGVVVLLVTCFLLDWIIVSRFFQKLHTHIDSVRAVQKLKMLSWVILALQAVEVMLILFLLLCSYKILIGIITLGGAVYCIWRIVHWIQWFTKVFKSPHKLVCSYYLRMCQLSRKTREYDKAFEAAQKALEFDSDNPYVGRVGQWSELADFENGIEGRSNSEVLKL